MVLAAWASGLGTFAGRDDRVQNGAFHARHELDNASVAYVLNKAVDDVVSEIAMGHLAAAETETCLDLVAACKELDGLILLGLVVMLVDGDGEFDFLDDDDFLLLLGGALRFSFS